MLVLPMRSPTPSPTRHIDAFSPSSRSKLEDSPHTSELRQRVGGAMLSVKPSTQAPTPKRPKLSLQTALPSPSTPRNRRPSLNLATVDLEAPTACNTYANSSDAPPPTPSSEIKPYIDFPTSSIPISAVSTPPASSIKPGHISPFPHEAPYILPIGTHSILRNSPLPKRLLSATSARAPKRMFPPIKRVAFQDKPAEVIPPPIIEEASEEDADSEPRSDEVREMRKEAIKAEDGHSIVYIRRRKKREWVWRPMPDDAFVGDSSFQADAEGDLRLIAGGSSTLRHEEQ
ncbi:MAG: hypothetical protein Q9217_002709 [Psora testacea]